MMMKLVTVICLILFLHQKQTMCLPGGWYKCRIDLVTCILDALLVNQAL